jgi:cytochrome c-type biogenesis protein CcmE
MKYKKHIATGALALSLLVSGSNVFAATPQDLGIKNSQQYLKQSKSLKINNTNTRRGNAVGVISSINSSGFIVDVKNSKTKATSSVDVKTDASTTYSKNGVSADPSILSAGQKVIVVGILDKTTNILTAKTVKMATN